MTPSLEDVNEIIVGDLAHCDAEQCAAFRRYKVEPHYVPIRRYGNMESVIVVARRGSEVIYWEDVEEGFNISPLDDHGAIREHWCNQDNLGQALNSWIEGRNPTAKLDPAEPV